MWDPTVGGATVLRSADDGRRKLLSFLPPPFETDTSDDLHVTAAEREVASVRLGERERDKESWALL